MFCQSLTEFDMMAILTPGSRPRAYLYARILELRNYPPGSERAHLFWFCHLQWHRLYTIALCIPSGDIAIAKEAAKEAFMSVREGQTMMTFDDDGDMESFPAPEGRVCCVVHEPGYPVSHDWEQEMVKKVEAECLS